MSIEIGYLCPACDEPIPRAFATGDKGAARSCLCAGCGKRALIMEGGIAKFIEEPPDAGFDERWRRHPKVQATTPGVFEAKTGWRSGELNGHTVLDAGAGCGRFSAAAYASGRAQHVVAVDGSTHGTLATRALLPESAQVAQADLRDLPFETGTFDAAFSLGVIHHTPDPAATLREIVRVVRPGGEIAVWVYGKPVRDDRALPALDFLHEVTRGCPPDVLYAACARYATKMRDAAAGVWGPLQEVVRMSSSADDDECVSDTFDWHAPQYRSWHTPAQVRGWFEAADCDVVWEGPFPVCVRGRRRGRATSR